MQRVWLDRALQHVPVCGFSEQALVRAVEAHSGTAAPCAIAPGALAAQCPRGVGVALCEHAVRVSSERVQRVLDERYGKQRLLDDVTAHAAAFAHGRHALPTAHDVVRTALTLHVTNMAAYTPRHLAHATALQLQPHNAPHAALLAVELVDTTCYHAERVTRLCELLAPARVLLQSDAVRAGDAVAAREGGSSHALLHALLQSVPLSAAPHDADGRFDVTWLARRTRVAAQFAAVTACLIGDDTPSARNTHALIASIA